MNEMFDNSGCTHSLSLSKSYGVQTHSRNVFDFKHTSEVMVRMTSNRLTNS